MAVRRIIRMGHPTLCQVAAPVDPAALGGTAFKRLLADMVDTLRDYGGVGLAAPQINESFRLAIIEIPGGPTRYGEVPPMPLTAFVNPEVQVLDATPNGVWEGCLSVPGLRGYVERPGHIRVSALNLAGQPINLELKGFLATVFQHEFDHLDGKLYIDRMADTAKLMFDEEYLRYEAEPPSEGD